MGCAEVISLTDVRASKQWDALRQQLHERFDQGLDTLALQCRELPSTLAQISDIVWGLRQSLTGGITATVVTQVHEGEHHRTQANCPQCARTLKGQAQVCRTVETMVGPVTRERPSCYCRSCQAGLSPVDDALG